MQKWCACFKLIIHSYQSSISVKTMGQCTYTYSLLKCAIEGIPEMKAIWKKFDDGFDLKVHYVLNSGPNIISTNPPSNVFKFQIWETFSRQ